VILSKLAGYSVNERVDGGKRGDQAGHTGRRGYWMLDSIWWGMRLTIL